MFLFHWLIGLAFIVWIYWLWTRRRYYATSFELPGPVGFPLLGVAHLFLSIEKSLETLHKLCERYGPLVYMWLGTNPYLVVIEPDIVRDILTSKYCVNKSSLYNGVRICTGNGLICSTDPEWSFHRKHINPAFRQQVLLSFMPIFNEEVNDLVETFRDIGKKNERFDLITTLQDFTLNVALRTTMGKHSRESQRNLMKSYHCIVELGIKIAFAPWLAYDVMRKLFGIQRPFNESKAEIEQFISNLIIEKLADEEDNLQPPAGAKNIFIDQVIDLAKRNIFTTHNVEVESNTIVMGAFETTANSIAFVLILLAMFPEYQRQAYEEILSIFPESGEFEVTYDNIQDMVYMDRVINESMRVLTPVPIVARENTQELKLSNGVVLPAGVQIGINIFDMHRRKDIWGPDAAIFNPDNFLPLNMEGKHPYAFIPFSKGSRNCIGWKYGLMATKVALAKLLRNYRFSTDYQYKDLEFIQNILLKLKHVPSLRVHKWEQ